MKITERRLRQLIRQVVIEESNTKLTDTKLLIMSAGLVLIALGSEAIIDKFKQEDHRIISAAKQELNNASGEARSLAIDAVPKHVKAIETNTPYTMVGDLGTELVITNQ